MAEYRHKDTGEVKTQGQWRSHYSNVSLPRAWKQATLDGLNLEAVLEAPKPTVGQYEVAARNGVTQDANGNWVTAWEVRAKTAEQIEQEAINAAASARAQRDRTLIETDWTQVADAPVDQAAWKEYRQALRDLPSHANWPNLNDADWPVKP